MKPVIKDGCLVVLFERHFSLSKDVNLRGAGITALPDGLVFKKNLILRGNPINTLPDDLKVEGNLDIRGTGITELPKKSLIGGFNVGEIFKDF